MNDPFQDFDEERSAAPVQPQTSQRSDHQGGYGSYAEEIASEKIMAKYRTFFIDLKQSINGKFIKISEKNHGKRNTIMLDSEDLPAFIEALQRIEKAL